MIAVFMGYKILFKNGNTIVVETGEGITQPIRDWAQYHTSWIWLMNAVEKIEKGGNFVTIERKSCGISALYPEEEKQTGLRFIIDPIMGESKIDAVFQAVSEFCLATPKQ
jgi:hypothetical protein